MVNGFSTSYPRSIAVSTAQTNGNQAGPQMAGLVPTETASVAQARAYQVRGSRQTQAFLTMPLYTTVQQSRPVWVTRNPPRFI